MDAPNPRITRHCDSIADLASMLTAAAHVGFRDVTVTSMKRQDRSGVPYTYYVLDLAERIEMRPDTIPFPDAVTLTGDAANGNALTAFVDTEHVKADDEDRRRHTAQMDTGHGRPRPA